MPRWETEVQLRAREGDRHRDLYVREASYVPRFRQQRKEQPEVQKQFREAIKIGYVEQALRLKKKIRRLLKLISVLLGAVAVALAVLLEVLERREQQKQSKGLQEPQDLKETDPQETDPQETELQEEDLQPEESVL